MNKKSNSYWLKKADPMIKPRYDWLAKQLRMKTGEEITFKRIDRMIARDEVVWQRWANADLIKEDKNE